MSPAPNDPRDGEIIERGHAAVVLRYDPARDRVVLIEQFRIGAYAAGLDPWMIEADAVPDHATPNYRAAVLTVQDHTDPNSSAWPCRS